MITNFKQIAFATLATAGLASATLTGKVMQINATAITDVGANVQLHLTAVKDISTYNQLCYDVKVLSTPVATGALQVNTVVQTGATGSGWQDAGNWAAVSTTDAQYCVNIGGTAPTFTAANVTAVKIFTIQFGSTSTTVPFTGSVQIDNVILKKTGTADEVVSDFETGAAWVLDKTTYTYVTAPTIVTLGAVVPPVTTGNKVMRIEAAVLATYPTLQKNLSSQADYSATGLQLCFDASSKSTVDAVKVTPVILTGGWHWASVATYTTLTATTQNICTSLASFTEAVSVADNLDGTVELNKIDAVAIQFGTEGTTGFSGTFDIDNVQIKNGATVVATISDFELAGSEWTDNLKVGGTIKSISVVDPSAVVVPPVATTSSYMEVNATSLASFPGLQVGYTGDVTGADNICYDIKVLGTGNLSAKVAIMTGGWQWAQATDVAITAPDWTTICTAIPTAFTEEVSTTAPIRDGIITWTAVNAFVIQLSSGATPFTGKFLIDNVVLKTGATVKTVISDFESGSAWAAGTGLTSVIVDPNAPVRLDPSVNKAVQLDFKALTNTNYSGPSVDVSLDVSTKTKLCLDVKILTGSTGSLVLAPVLQDGTSWKYAKYSTDLNSAPAGQWANYCTLIANYVASPVALTTADKANIKKLVLEVRASTAAGFTGTALIDNITLDGVALMDYQTTGTSPTWAAATTLAAMLPSIKVVTESAAVLYTATSSVRNNAQQSSLGLSLQGRQLTVQAPNAVALVKVEIFDLRGKSVLTAQGSADLSALTSGSYMVKVTQGSLQAIRTINLR